MVINLRRQTNQSTQQGIALIEVLVAVALISIGLLGMMALQMTSLQTNQAAVERSFAVMQAASLLDRIRANPEDDKTIYNLAAGFNVGAAVPAACSANNLCNADIGEWQTLTDDNVPGFTTTVNCALVAGTDLHDCSVTLDWVSPQLAENMNVTVRTQL